jgi:hypothetical protein
LKKSKQFLEFYYSEVSMSGGGKGGGGAQVVQMPPQTTTTNSVSEPWKVQQPYLQQGFSRAADLFLNNHAPMYPGEMVAPYSPETQVAQSLITNRAIDGSPVMNAGNNTLQNYLSNDYLNSDKTANGDYLYGGQGFNAAVDAAIRRATPQVNSQFALSGQTGRTGLADAAIAQQGLDAFASQYANERQLQEAAKNNLSQNQMRALTMAPTYAANDYNDYAQLLNVGQMQDQQNQKLINENMYKFNYPYETAQNNLTKYMGLVQGNYGGSQSGTSTGTGNAQLVQGGNPVMNAFSGANAGAGLMAGLGFNPLIGAGLGLLAGFF